MLLTSGVLLLSDRHHCLQKVKMHRSASYQRVWFITGSSAGVGRALTEAVLARGERAVVTARTPERVRDLIERYPAQALVLELDVTRPDQVRRVIQEAIERFGHIDVLVNVDVYSGALAHEVAPLAIKVITIDSGRANGHPAGDSADDIIATVDADNVKSSIS
jgi:NAD(P)-dependent dehydrogenase (short-subunit alcohol dehydrogenase family)